MPITTDYSVFLNGCIKNDAVDYKILYENKCKENEELIIKSDAENTADMIHKLNEEYNDLYQEKEKMKNELDKIKLDKINNKEILEWFIKDKKYEYQDDEDFINNYLYELPADIMECEEIIYILEDTFGIVKMSKEEIEELKNEYYNITFITNMSNTYGNINIQNIEEYSNNFSFKDEFIHYCYETGCIEYCNDLQFIDGCDGMTYWKIV